MAQQTTSAQPQTTTRQGIGSFIARAADLTRTLHAMPPYTIQRFDEVSATHPAISKVA